MLRKIDVLDNFLLRSWRNSNAQFFPPGPVIDAGMQGEWYTSYLLRPEDHQYMVLEGNRPVGTLAINVRDKMIGRVMRGRPEGKGLMGAALIDLMLMYGEGTYVLQVLEDNKHAIEFYERLGFRIFGRQLYGKDAPYVMLNMKTEYRL